MAIAALIPLAVALVPELLRSIAGDKTGRIAEQAVDIVRTITSTDDPKQAQNILGTDSAKMTELRVQLSQLVVEQEKNARQAELDMFRAAVSDANSARQQTVSLAASGSNIAWAAPVMSLVITGGFFACIILLMVKPITWDQNASILLNTLFGALVIAFGQVCNYWLGSSAGSKRSGDAVREIANRAQGNQQPTAIATTGDVQVSNPPQPAPQPAPNASADELNDRWNPTVPRRPSL